MLGYSSQQLVHSVTFAPQANAPGAQGGIVASDAGLDSTVDALVSTSKRFSPTVNEAEDFVRARVYWDVETNVRPSVKAYDVCVYHGRKDNPEPDREFTVFMLPQDVSQGSLSRWLTTCYEEMS